MACKTCLGLGVRHIQLFLVMCGFAVVLIFRICPMMAIRLGKQEHKDSSSYHEDPFKNTIVNWAEIDLLPLDFCLYYGYPIGLFIGGVISVRLNPKYSLLSTTLFLSLMSFAVPSVLRSRSETVGHTAIIVIRVVIGFFQGVNESLSYQILGRWAPVMDYCKASLLIPAGNLAGYLMMQGAMHFIGKNVMGWATVFYTAGNIGILWCVAWATFGSNDFRSCFYISAEERFFLVNNTVDLDSFGMTGRGEKRPYRWKMLFSGKTSKDLYVLIIASTSIDWAQSNIMIPRFMEDYFGSGLHPESEVTFWNNKVVFFILGVGVFLFCWATAFISDYIVNRKKVPESHQRKTCNSIGLWGQAIVFVLSGFATSDSSKKSAAELALVTFLLAPFTYLGIGTSFMSMAPNYTGFTYGIVKSISNVPLAVYFFYVQVTISDMNYHAMNRIEYRMFAFSSALVYFFANFVYVSLFSCRVQEWNKVFHAYSEKRTVAFPEKCTRCRFDDVLSFFLTIPLCDVYVCLPNLAVLVESESFAKWKGPSWSHVRETTGWMKNRRKLEGAENLWRIDDCLYDLEEFAEVHPGGKQWIEITRGTDVTEVFKSFHVSETPRAMLSKFYVKKAATRRNSPFTFDPDGFYEILRKRAQETIVKQKLKPSIIPKIFSDILLLLTITSGAATASTGSHFLGLISGLLLCGTTVCAHNFFHQRDNWRMYYFQISGLSVKGWRMSHAMSHHIFPNSQHDLEVAMFEPWLQWLPQPKNYFWRFVSWVYSPLVYTLIFPASVLLRFAITGHDGLPETLPLIIPAAMFYASLDPVVTLYWWAFVFLASSFFFGLIGLNAGHHLPDLFHEGDQVRNNESMDWGEYQMITVKDRVEIRDSILGLVTFGDHCLHHMFPTLDHSVLTKLYPDLLTTCREFGFELGGCSLWEGVKGQFLQLSRVKKLSFR